MVAILRLSNVNRRRMFKHFETNQNGVPGYITSLKESCVMFHNHKKQPFLMDVLDFARCFGNGRLTKRTVQEQTT
jgi:hypothetical protein